MPAAGELAPRPYRGLSDLPAVQAVLVAGRAAMQTGQARGYYVHTGDLSWWLFYLNQADDLHANLTLWESAAGVVAWSLLSPAYRAFDVFVHPALHGTPAPAALWAWTEARLAEVAGAAVRTMWVAEDDAALIAWLSGRGYTPDPDDYLWSLERPLTSALPAPRLPDGFTVRPVAGQAEAAPRALAGHAAFSSRLPVDAYVERYRRFMRSPIYGSAFDLAVVPPDSSADGPPVMAAFAIAWPDHANGVGLFEPVGTHPHYQRQGLGRAVIDEGLRRLQQAGLRTATVCAAAGNPAARRLYESAGFVPVRKLLTYAKH